MWAADGPLLAGEITDRLDTGHAYTSIATVLSRLVAKGLVERTASGRAFTYRTIVDESELAARRLGEVLNATSDRSKVLSRFIGGLSAREVDAVRTLLSESDRRRGS